MIYYEPTKWFTLIFHNYSRRVVRMLFPSLVFMFFYTLLICYVVLDVLDVPFKSTTQVHSILGIVLGLFLVFRMNSAYARWWEGREKWGDLVNNTRNLALKFNAYFDRNDKQNRSFFSKMIANYPFALKEHLRKGVKFDELEYPEEDIKEKLKSADHVPNRIGSMLYKKVDDLLRAGTINNQQLFIIDKELKSFTDIMGACERIKNTPIPYSYSMYIKKFIFTFVITLPFGFVTSFDYWTIPIVLLLFYILVSIELIAEEIEDPFGTDVNDLPTDDLSVKIRKNIKEILLDPEASDREVKTTMAGSEN